MNLLCASFLLSALAASPQVEVHTLSGQTVAGSVKQLDAQRVVLETASGEQVFSTKDLLGLSLRKPPKTESRPQVWVELTDGTRLVGLEYTARQGQAALRLLDGHDIEIATQSVAVVRFKEQNEKIARQWADIVAMARSTDMIVVRREEAIDYLDGVLGDVSPEAVHFTVDGDPVNVRRQRVEGVLCFHPQRADLPEVVCRVDCHDGSHLPAVRLALAEGGLSIVTPGELELVRPLEAIKEIDFSLGKIRYLSDLDWESFQRQDFLSAPNVKPDPFYDPQKNTSFVGPLRLGNKTYAKGLALKSYTRVVYHLPGKFSRLVAVAGINAQLPHGDLTLKISGDQREEPLLETTIAGGDAPQELSLDLTGVRRLTIEVGYGSGGDAGDHLNLGDARIIQ